MKSLRLYLTVVTTFNIVILFGQGTSLTFTANYSCSYTPLDSVLVENLTKGVDTTLYWSDTVLFMNTLSANEYNLSKPVFKIAPNSPNPFNKETTIDIYVLTKNNYEIRVHDHTNRLVASYNETLLEGMHSFVFTAEKASTYIISVMTNNQVNHIKMIAVEGGTSTKLRYKGLNIDGNQAYEMKNARSYFAFSIGDELRLTAYAFGESTELLVTPTNSAIYEFAINNDPPLQPSADINVVDDHSIIWNWQNSSNTEGYAYNFINDYASATDLGGGTSLTQTDLIFCYDYSLYVWSYNNCGESEALLLTETTTADNPEFESPYIFGDTVLIRFYHPAATSVALAGTMNGWNQSAHPMEPICNNWWEIYLIIGVDVQDGDEYKIVVNTLNNTTWYHDPENPNMVMDGVGGYNSVIVLP
jgi:hypothetical protein